MKRQAIPYIKSSFYPDSALSRIQGVLRIVIGLTFVSSAVLKGIAVRSFVLVARDFLNLVGLDFLPSGFVAIAVCFGEGFIGIMAMLPLVYNRIHWIYPLLMVFFTILTYLNLTDPYGGIESCGCFGEVIHLNPLQSHLKNIVLLALTFVASILTWTNKCRDVPEVRPHLQESLHATPLHTERIN